MKTIIVCDAIHPVGFELLKKEQDINVIDAVNTPKDELLKAANLLDKLKNQKTYKKEKHKNKFKDED